MKKIIALLLSLLLISTLIGCEKKKDSGEIENDIYEKVVKTYQNDRLTITNEYSDLSFTDSISNITLSYRLFLPANYNSSEKYPVLLFLHGYNQIIIGEDILGGFSEAFSVAGDILSSAIVIAPQCPSGHWWYLDHVYDDERGVLGTAKHLLDYIIKKYNGDTDRIYVTGLSMGGYATWELLSRYGNFFAAGVPICGAGANTEYAEKLSNIPIKIYHGKADPTVNFSVSQRMYDSISAYQKGLVEFIALEDVGHGAWIYAYSDRTLFEWLFSQNRKTHQTIEYTPIPSFEVKSPRGRTIISDQDVFAAYTTLLNDEKSIELILTPDAKKRLVKEYKKYNGKTFTVYLRSKKLYDYKALKAREDDYYNILKTVDDSLFLEIEKIFNYYLSNSLVK